ncbi:hypothetical protein V6N11_067319 [Hibiscus sabdariffa]|uniref:Secreted protein n=1 Tax=Hibiscus sabdariffa TaxID=183260 RepID=A0ABR2SR45_9ROSI
MPSPSSAALNVGPIVIFVCLRTKPCYQRNGFGCRWCILLSRNLWLLLRSTCVAACLRLSPPCWCSLTLLPLEPLEP